MTDDLSYFDSVCDDIRNNRLEFFETDFLPPQKRKEIYKIIDSYGLHGTTIESENNFRIKKIKITKKSIDSINSIQLTNDMLQLFSNYADLPNLENKNINTYEKLYDTLDMLEKYYPNVKKQWNLFSDEVKISGTSELRVKMKNTKKLIFDYINNNQEYKQFKNTYVDVDHSDICIQSTIYKPENNKKVYVCVDVKSAVYQVLKYKCPSIMQSWSEIVQSITDSKFMLQSKQYRKDIFTGLKCDELLKCMIEFIIPIELLVKSNSDFNNNMKKVFLLQQGDEIIYEIIGDVSMFNLEKFSNEVNKINPDIYTITMFELVHLNKINNRYYKKIYNNGFEQFKCVPRDALLEVIKMVNNK